MKDQTLTGAAMQEHGDIICSCQDIRGLSELQWMETEPARKITKESEYALLAKYAGATKHVLHRELPRCTVQVHTQEAVGHRLEFEKVIISKVTMHCYIIIKIKHVCYLIYCFTHNTYLPTFLCLLLYIT